MHKKKHIRTLGTTGVTLFCENTSTGHRFTLHDVDLSRQIMFPILYDLYDLYDLAHVTGWEPYNLHDLAHVSWVRSVL